MNYNSCHPTNTKNKNFLSLAKRGSETRNHRLNELKLHLLQR